MSILMPSFPIYHVTFLSIWPLCVTFLFSFGLGVLCEQLFLLYNGSISCLLSIFLAWYTSLLPDVSLFLRILGTTSGASWECRDVCLFFSRDIFPSLPVMHCAMFMVLGPLPRHRHFVVMTALPPPELSIRNQYSNKDALPSPESIGWLAQMHFRHGASRHTCLFARRQPRTLTHRRTPPPHHLTSSFP